MNQGGARSMMVTGASGGVGRELLLLTRLAGWDVVGIYHRNQDQAEAISKEWKDARGLLRMLACDLTKPDEVCQLLNTLTDQYCPDVLVHLAAPPIDARPLRRVEWQDCQHQLDGLLKPLVILTPTLVRRMAHRGSGRVITALSAVILGKPPRGFSSYVTAKYAVMGYLNCIAAEYAERGVAVNTVSPEAMNTGLLKDLPGLLTDQMREANAGGKWIEPSSVARVIFWLAAEAPPELSGCNLPLTSGTSL
jgi:3-oxoacyl-[acyl-carrier protein] reductase